MQIKWPKIRECTFHLGIFLLNDSVWDEKSFLSMTWEQRAWDYNRETWLKTSKRQPWIESDNGRIPELLLSFSSKAEYMWKVCHFSKSHIPMDLKRNTNGRKWKEMPDKNAVFFSFHIWPFVFITALVKIHFQPCCCIIVCKLSYAIMILIVYAIQILNQFYLILQKCRDCQYS